MYTHTYNPWHKQDANFADGFILRANFVGRDCVNPNLGQVAGNAQLSQQLISLGTLSASLWLILPKTRVKLLVKL